MEEQVNHPSHYNQYDMETIVMMEKIWGRDAVILWCKMTAYKYRMRMGLKEGNPIEQDLAKEKFYLDYARKLIAVTEKSLEAEMSDLIAMQQNDGRRRYIQQICEDLRKA